MHQLWKTKTYNSATLEEVIAALFDPPPFIEPEDIDAINKYHPSAKANYLHFFYKGDIPEYIQRINKLGEKQ